ncbi:hypothetical protein BFW87_20015 [Pseudomonas fluorescens]|uniref:EpsG family protein n=1 Tax=Pseudomonas fluorescens TaxID=294 RepID=A0A1T2YGP8_PSEFL|nr:EpsG family protein [Pseudomonas fluorescens]OPA91295.1 hypothetical protein BFW87_20015 [Pseudomonas fluorescens]
MYKKRSLSIFFALLVCLIMWGLYGWNSWNGDRDGYELYYHTRDTLSSWGGEFGYGYLNIIASQSGLSFQGFQILMSLATLLLLFRYFTKQTLSPFASIVIYLVCFFSLDFVLMRNFFAFAIFLQGIILLYEGKRYCRVKYVALILLATAMHQSSLMFMVFVFIPLNRVVPLGRFLFVYISFIVFYLLVRYAVPLPESIANHFDFYNTTWKSVTANIVTHLVSFVLFALAVMAERKSLHKLDCSSGREKELAFILNINIFSLFFLVLYFESEIFVRLLRVIIFFNLLHCVNSLFLKRRTYLFLLAYIFIFGGYLILFFLVPVAQDTYISMFKNNLLLN